MVVAVVVVVVVAVAVAVVVVVVVVVVVAVALAVAVVIVMAVVVTVLGVVIAVAAIGTGIVAALLVGFCLLLPHLLPPSRLFPLPLGVPFFLPTPTPSRRLLQLELWAGICQLPWVCVLNVLRRLLGDA